MRSRGAALPSLDDAPAGVRLPLVVIVVLFVVVGYGVLDEVGDGELELIAGVTVAGLIGAAVAIYVMRRNERLHAAIQPMLTSTMGLLSRQGTPLVAITLAVWLFDPLKLWRIPTQGLEDAADFSIALVALAVAVFALGWVEDLAARRPPRISPFVKRRELQQEPAPVHAPAPVSV